MIYTLVRGLALLALKGLCRFRVEGKEHVPARGGVLLAANHVSYVDPVVVGCAVRRRLHYLAKEELFRRPAAGWFLRQLQAFPISRSQAEPSVLKRTLALLRRGEAVLVFPEGTRGDGRQLLPGKAGAGLLALRSGCPVVPVYHEGGAAMLPRGRAVPRPAPVRVRIGPPIRFAPAAGEDPRRFETVSQQIMAAIARLQGGMSPTLREAPMESRSL